MLEPTKNAAVSKPIRGTSSSRMRHIAATRSTPRTTQPAASHGALSAPSEMWTARRGGMSLPADDRDPRRRTGHVLELHAHVPGPPRTVDDERHGLHTDLEVEHRLRLRLQR